MSEAVEVEAGVKEVCPKCGCKDERIERLGFSDSYLPAEGLLTHQDLCQCPDCNLFLIRESHVKPGTTEWVVSFHEITPEIANALLTNQRKFGANLVPAP